MDYHNNESDSFNKNDFQSGGKNYQTNNQKNIIEDVGAINQKDSRAFENAKNINTHFQNQTQNIPYNQNMNQNYKENQLNNQKNIFDEEKDYKNKFFNNEILEKIKSIPKKIIIIACSTIIAAIVLICIIVAMMSSNKNQKKENIVVNNIEQNEIQSSDADIETFNQNFTLYEGNNINSERVRELLQTIFDMNFNDNESTHKIEKIALNKGRGEASKSNLKLVNDNIKDNMTYTITFEQSDEGYINEVYINENI